MDYSSTDSCQRSGDGRKHQILPIPQSPFVHTHELRLPVTVPNTPGTMYAQVLQLDAGAAGGVSFTPGIKIEIGN